MRKELSILQGIGRVSLFFGSLIFFHAAYSTWEARVLSADPELSRGSLPKDIFPEVIASFTLLALGVVFTATPLKEISWVSEYRHRNIDQIDARVGFMDLHHRGKLFFGDGVPVKSAPTITLTGESGEVKVE
ncbi:uncharacterized protein L969DRAFT_18306 [Mixia osmundae IAM 14324]|uniref:Membrane magnesium transporter n=1 Tax=Mixia osmundae (strain CBS 9802 / IAM 14324 / JCM 22182 / KY 12970) TaxID=764103 RepID=G7DZ73_MIXOS|nr:uncharacterized protein L969DRAFT_18306 [Mixia osmundae IAM 14324]KEI38285.1 hypothetical protein L969DRAFT_18306 [Mixia osmundae IAM 14324]GAA95883.1 hypothetical protein E5Q_02541 [Mixia osmundae IAM 14324]